MGLSSLHYCVHDVIFSPMQRRFTISARVRRLNSKSLKCNPVRDVKGLGDWDSWGSCFSDESTFTFV